MASLAMLMPEAEQTASHDMLKPEAKETAFQALFKPDADKKASQNLITLKPNKMASYTMLLSKADDVAYQALLKPESNEMAYQVLNMCEAEEVHPTPCSSQRLPRWPPKTSSLLRPMTQPFKPGFHLILHDYPVQAQPFDPIKPIVNPPPASCQYAPCPLLGSFTTPSPYQRHYLPQNFGPCVDILPRGQDCWGEVCQVSPLTLSVKALCILLQPGARQHTSGFAHLFSFTCPLVLGPVSSLVMSTCFCVFS